MPGEQNFKVFLSFKDEATGKFIKATEEQIASIKKLGLAVKKEGVGVGLELYKMAKAHENLGRKSRTSNEQITGFIRAMGSLRNMILVYMFALRPLFELIKESTKAYIEQEDSLIRLNFALGLQGTTAKVVSDNLVALSKRFQETTRYSDETALKIMDTLVTVGNIMPAELGKVTQSVLDFASATRRDPVEAAVLFARASQGITTGLRRAGIVIDEATPKTRVLAEAIRYVNENMGGRAQADITTYGGKIAQLVNSYSELRESLGRLMITGLNLPYVVQFWKEAFDSLNKKLGGETLTVLDIFEKRLSDINKKIAASGAEAIAKQKASPLWFITGGYSESEIKKAQSLLAEREVNIRNVAFEKQRESNQRILVEQAIVAEREKQLKIDAQEKFNTAYSRLSSVRIDYEKKALKEDYDIYSKFVEDKVSLDKWYLEEKIRIHKEELRLTPRMETAKESIESLNDFLGKEGTAYITFMKAFAKGAEQALTEGFINIVKGNFEGLGDVVASFGDMLLQTMMQLAAQAILVKVGFAAFLGLHTGGYIQYGREASAGYGKKFHSGGEVPATLLEGEGVLNRRGMGALGVDNLNKLNRGEQAGSGAVINNYYIQTIDERSFRERLQEHGDVYSGAAEEGIRDNTSLRKTTQRWGG